MPENRPGFKEKVYRIIFESDTTQGKAFDVFLVVFIIGSSMIVLLDSIESMHKTYGSIFFILEWICVSAFTLEYILRIYCVGKRMKYVKSFFGIIDLLSILPALISFFIPSTQFLLVVRILRLLRLFRIFKMVRYVKESNLLLTALKSSRPKITVFIFTMLFVVIAVGSLMYIVEGPDYGYDSIPQSMYWAITTVTTVGYGDISPGTPAGKFIASLLMIVAYGVLAVPTGIFSYELAQATKRPEKTRACPQCKSEIQAPDAIYCHKCGTKIDE